MSTDDVWVNNGKSYTGHDLSIDKGLKAEPVGTARDDTAGPVETPEKNPKSEPSPRVPAAVMEAAPPPRDPPHVPPGNREMPTAVALTRAVHEQNEPKEESPEDTGDDGAGAPDAANGPDDAGVTEEEDAQGQEKKQGQEEENVKGDEEPGDCKEAVDEGNEPAEQTEQQAEQEHGAQDGGCRRFWSLSYSMHYSYECFLQALIPADLNQRVK